VDLVFEGDLSLLDAREVDGVFALFAGDWGDECWVWRDLFQAGEVLKADVIRAEG